MTRKRLGAIDRESISIMRDVAEKSAAERRGLAATKAPPIGQVAGSAARSIEEDLSRLKRERDGLQADATAWVEAREAGLVVELIALDMIDDHALSRDRRQLDRDGEPWWELKDSLRVRGQQTPIEVTGPDAETGLYHLVSGYRRLNALKELLAETDDPRFETVKALVTERPETVDAMIAMIEENEIRQDVSFYERGRICCLAAEQGICGDVEEAIQILFANSSRNRRYKIRNFTVIHKMIGSYLDYPEAIGERLGARLAQTLKEGRGDELTAVLLDRGEKFSEATEEILLLENFVSRKGVFADRKAAKRQEEMRGDWMDETSGLMIAGTAKKGRVLVEIKGLNVSDQEELEHLLERLGKASTT